MKKIVLLAGLIAVTVFAKGSAQNRDFGLGIILGEPSGISVKSWTGNRTAFDGAAAWSLGDRGRAYLHADYLIHSYEHIDVEGETFPFYYGIGARVILADDAKIGARIPLGLNYLFDNNPFELFFELVPVVNLVPDQDFDLNGGIGVRYYFN